MQIENIREPVEQLNCQKFAFFATSDAAVLYQQLVEVTIFFLVL